MYKLTAMDKQIDIKEVLDWYIWAGVNETCGDFVCLSENKEASLTELKAFSSASKEQSSFKTHPSPLQTSANYTVKNARDICAKATTLQELREITANFQGCNLKKTAAHTVFGDGAENARIVLVGEAPGADEDRIGRPFVGRCGKLLDKMLASIGVERQNCFITNVLPWRPPGNRPPTDDEIAVCMPFLKRQIELISPDYLLLLGGVAFKSLMETQDTISRARGKWFEYSLESGKTVQVLATYHPSFLLRSSAQKAKAWADLLRLKKKAIKDI